MFSWLKSDACYSGTAGVSIFSQQRKWDPRNVRLLWDDVKPICDRAAVISTAGTYCGRQTEPDWTLRVTFDRTPPPSFDAPPGCGTPTVGSFMSPRLHHITPSDHPILEKKKKKKKLRSWQVYIFSRMQSIWASTPPPLNPSGPLLTWEPPCLLRSPCLVCGMLRVCGLVIGDSWEPL